MKGDIQIVYPTTHDSKGYLDEQSFAQAQLSKPDTINAVLTHLGGRLSDKFPMTFLTEGQKGGGDYRENIQDAQFLWDVMERPKKFDAVKSHGYTSTMKPGIGLQDVILVFPTKCLIEQTVVVSGNNVKCRVDRAPRRVPGGYEYALKLASGNPADFVPFSEIGVGSKWAMVSPGTVSESDSKGNRSNDRFPGKMKNQLTFMRSSYRYGGNVANTNVMISFVQGNGVSTTLYLAYKDFEHEMLWRENVEEMCFESTYNRRADGSIGLIDGVSGKPVPLGAGLFEQVPNEEGYGELTYTRLNDAVGDVAYGATDTENMQIVLLGGKGFMRDFDFAIKSKALSLSQVTGDRFIKGEGRNLALTGYFKQFDHIDGHTVIAKYHRLFDFGGRAQASAKHPVTGFPLTSHEAFFIDMTNYDGQRNVKMVSQKGRNFIKGFVKGMAPALGGSAGYGFAQAGGLMATEQDTNSVHFFGSKSININRNEHCLRFVNELS